MAAAGCKRWWPPAFGPGPLEPIQALVVAALEKLGPIGSGSPVLWDEQLELLDVATGGAQDFLAPDGVGELMGAPAVHEKLVARLQSDMPIFVQEEEL